MTSTATANDTTTKPTIVAIKITEGAQSWGEPVTQAQDDEMHRRYAVRARELLETKFRGVEIAHHVQRDNDASANILVVTDTLASGWIHPARDAVREILGAAWQQTCEGSSDIFGDL